MSEYNSIYLLFFFWVVVVVVASVIFFNSDSNKATDGKLIWTNTCSRSMVYLTDDFTVFEELEDVKKEIELQSYREWLKI